MRRDQTSAFAGKTAFKTLSKRPAGTARNRQHLQRMTQRTPTRQGPLEPRAEKDSVVVEDPSNDSIVMTADEADLSGIRMLEEAAKARDNEAKGERSE